MNISPRTRRVAATLVTILAAGALWFTLAPTQVGGGVDYVVIHGTSMEPKLHAGDLVMLRHRSSYQVGQVVGYQSGLLHELVLHRIIGVKNGHYLFKGDHNDFVDSYSPTHGALVGRLWLRIPYAGGLLAWARQPRQAAFLSVLVVLFFVTGTRVPRRVRRKGAPGAAEPEPRTVSHDDGSARLVPLSALAAACGFAVLALVAFAHPQRALVADPAGYTQAASYAYSADAPRSTVYPRGVVHTGDPIYLSLVHQLGLSLRYRFASTLAHAVSGTIALRAQLKSGGGWTQSVASAPAHAFHGDTGTSELRVDLSALRRKMQAFRSEADVMNETFTLTVAPRVRIHGLVGGRTATSSFAPAPLVFNIDDQSAELAQQPTTSTVPGEPAADPLSVSQPGAVERVQPASLSLGVMSLGVAQARRIGLAGGIVCALFAAGCLAVLRRRPKLDELAAALRLFEPWQIPVTTPLTGQSVEVASADSLATVAGHYDAPILYEQRDGIHIFCVESAGQQYRYSIVESPLPEHVAAAEHDVETLLPGARLDRPKPDVPRSLVF